MDQIEAPWSPEEDEMLENLIEKHGDNWSLISKYIPGKSDQSCRSRWLSLVKKKMDQIDNRLWSPEEDEMLQYLIEKHGPSWSLISKSIPDRSGKSCRSRWLSLVEKKMDQIDRLWSPEEDEMLENLVKEHGRNWLLISKSIPGKSAKSCSSRWSFVHWPFMPEDEIILRFHARIGDIWAAIGRFLSAGKRTDENRWNSALKWKSSSMTNEAKIQGQAPTISDMARENMSSGSTHSYSRDRSAPTWNALNNRDSSTTVTESDNLF